MTSVSNATREAKKRKLAQEQIDRNLESKAVTIDVCGREALQTVISPMDAYSTKFMCPEDQFVLAVDRVDTPEVKTALAPEFIPVDNYIDSSDEDIFDYAAHLSLNFGDQDALLTLEAKASAAPLRCYMFADGGEGECPSDDASDGDADGAVESENDELVVAEENDASGEDDWRGRNITSADLGDINFLLVYKLQEPNKVQFVFDLYDGGEMSQNPGIPSISAAFVVSKEYSRYTQGKLKWEYVISLHLDENKKPKDAATKLSYLKLQRFMRATIVTMGILPSKL